MCALALDGSQLAKLEQDPGGQEEGEVGGPHQQGLPPPKGVRKLPLTIQ